MILNKIPAIRLLSLLISAGIFLTAAGQSTDNSRPVTSYYNLEVGGAKTVATYLSPIHYHGTEWKASGYWWKALPFSPEHSVMTFDAGIYGGRMLNPAGTASMLNAGAEFKFGMAYRTLLPYGLDLTAGGYAGVEGGAMWLMRNSNNPVEAQVFAGIGAQASLSYTIKIGKLPVLISDRVSLPLAGAFFSPAYGETYYEIYIGNHKNLVHFGYPGNRFGIDNLIGFTLDFGRTAMQIGYRYRFQNEEACNLVTRKHSHAIVIGVVPGGLKKSTDK